MALGCVRVDLTVRLGRGVEGMCITTASILGVALDVSTRHGLALGLYCQKFALGSPDFKGFAPHMLQIGKRNELSAICLAGKLFPQWWRKRW